jgi:exopolysaccharide biosynthesis predicted pyruvyltransferase EpsI
MHTPALAADAVRQLTTEIKSTLRAQLPGASTVALLDFPAHVNAGDSLIYLGQRQILRDLGYDVGYVGDTRIYCAAELRRRVPSGPIFLQGGGNLGDRWLHTQEFREQVIRDFPDRPIVQLPQSIDFSDERRRQVASEIFASHPNLLLLMRDQRSLARARAAFPDTRVEFCPDLAVGYGPQVRPSAPDLDLVLLLRDDTERSSSRSISLPPEVTRLQRDWGFPGSSRVKWNLSMLPSAISRHVRPLRSPLQPWVESSFETIADLNVETAKSILSRGRFVITDRLHAAVLAALMGIPVNVLDNANGKISAAYEDYLHRLPTLTFVGSLEEAERNFIDHFEKTAKSKP